MVLRKTTSCLLAISLLFTAVSSVVAADIRQANKAVRMQDFAAAAKIYQELAQDGNSEAQYQLASLYIQGKGVAKNSQEAQKWMTQAAEQGLASAQFGLAQLIKAKQPDQAQQLIESAAAQEYRPALSYLKRAEQEPSKSDNRTPFETQWFGAARNNHPQELEKLNALQPSVNLTDKVGRTAIFYAIEANSQQAFKWLVENGANISQTDNYGATPLQVAMERRNKDIVKSLLNAGANPKVSLHNGDSLIHYALRLEQYDLVPPLLSAGVPVNQKNKEGWTALDLAEYKAATKTAQLIAKNGGVRGNGWRNDSQPVDVQLLAKQLSSENLPPVALAVINGNQKLLNNLVKKEPSLLGTRLNDDSTLPILAIKHHKPQMLRALINLGSNVLQTGYQNVTPLHVATRQGDLESVNILLGAGANPTQRDAMGRDSVMTAIEYNQPEIANKLLDNLAGQGRSESEIRVHLKTSDIPVNNYILRATQHRMISFVDRLLPYATDTLEVDEQQRDALWFAAEAGDPKLVLKLIKAGLEPDHQDNLGRTPFIIAVDTGCLECARQLLGFADINHQTHSGNTALMLAAAKGDSLISAWLIQNKADIEIRNRRGNTAIMEAVNANSKEIVTYLLKANANVTRKNKLGFSAIDLAKQTSPQMHELVKSKSVLGLF